MTVWVVVLSRWCDSASVRVYAGRGVRSSQRGAARVSAAGVCAEGGRGVAGDR